MNHELTLLQSQLAQLNRKQESIVWDIDHMVLAGLEGTIGTPETEETDVAEITPEEELERAEAELQAQVDFF